MKTGDQEILAVCASKSKGERKVDKGQGELLKGFGLAGDAHGGDWHRQVSLLAIESIDKMRAAGLNVGPGDFAENLTTRGVDLYSLPVGTRLLVGEAALLEITQIGKVCHDRCAIYHQAGDCVMPREGVFAVVLEGGPVKSGDALTIVEPVIRNRNQMMNAGVFRIGVLTLSDKGARGQRVDESGPVVQGLLAPLGDIVQTTVLPDDVDAIVAVLKEWSDQEQLNLIVTTGGTGLTARDVTPQATLQVIDYEIPGMAEVMRRSSLEKTPHAMLSRAVVGVRCQTMIVNLPGSPKGARENLEVLLPALPHALAKLAGDPSDCASQ